ncbi:hypothetical protein GCM10007415_41980 [Parapedobacter pyrenivorans]|uniref:Uncharacterized protein n=1 Tax=Parapedobacter pyrenivorans TaxID=1305674 RepID=A0A917I1P2_9SPHI|nr:hypothetical protein [Parapedobacter pyrenivorans]GGH01459.1 hypothetical protein GCM10007415_41980 [Parapedobacter pyrenivorans]
MKKVFKVNLGVVMALFAAFGLMSFKLSTNNAMQAGWYVVEPPDGLGQQAMGDFISVNPPDEGNCIADLETEICAAEWDGNGTFPATLQQLQTDNPSARVAGTDEP